MNKKLTTLLLFASLFILSFFIQKISAEKSLSISGTVFDDKNLNGIQDAQEMPLKNIPVGVQFISKPGKIINLKTNNTGRFSFMASEQGFYTLGFNIPKDYKVTTPQNFRRFYIGESSAKTTVNMGMTESALMSYLSKSAVPLTLTQEDCAPGETLCADQSACVQDPSTQCPTPGGSYECGSGSNSEYCPNECPAMSQCDPPQGDYCDSGTSNPADYFRNCNNGYKTGGVCDKQAYTGNCAPGAVCSNNQCVLQTEPAPDPSPNNCGNEICSSDQFCYTCGNARTCTGPLQEGMACCNTGGQNQCQDGLTCTNGTCSRATPVQRPVNSACNANSECISRNCAVNPNTGSPPGVCCASGEVNRDGVCASNTGTDTLTLYFAPPTPPKGMVGSNYTGVLGIWVHSQRDNRYLNASQTTLSTARGTLPPGLAINDQVDFIDGQPTQGGTFNFTIKACRTDAPSVCSEASTQIIIEGGDFSANPTVTNTAVNCQGGTPQAPVKITYSWTKARPENLIKNQFVKFRFLQSGWKTEMVPDTTTTSRSTNFALENGNYELSIGNKGSGNTNGNSDQFGEPKDGIFWSPVKKITVACPTQGERRPTNTIAPTKPRITPKPPVERKDPTPIPGRDGTAPTPIPTIGYKDPNNPTPIPGRDGTAPTPIPGRGGSNPTPLPTDFIAPTPIPGEPTTRAITPQCGDDICNGSETSSTCPSDCRSGNNPPRQPNPAATEKAAPTVTPAPVDTLFTVSAIIPGIGNNPGDNPNPKNPTRTAEIFVYKTDDPTNILGKGRGPVTYNAQNRTFSGKITVNNLPPGTYKTLIKIKLDNTVRKTASQDLSLTSGSTISLPTAILNPGDFDNNNRIDLSDYNNLVSCFGTKLCGKKDIVDVNDDGMVDIIDLNIFQRSIAFQSEGN